MQQENKYINKFNWKQFFKIFGSMLFLGVGISIGATSNGKLGLLVLAFTMAAIGVALLAAE